MRFVYLTRRRATVRRRGERLRDRGGVQRDVFAHAARQVFAERAVDHAHQPVVDRHQALMWEVRDLMHQWEELQSQLERA